MDTGFCDASNMTFAFHPETQTGADGSQIVLGTIMRIEIFRMEDRFRIVFTIAQPFGSGCKTGIIRVAQIIGIVFTTTQPVFEIEPANFIIILDGSQDRTPAV